jgi:hypothetical protein
MTIREGLAVKKIPASLMLIVILVSGCTFQMEVLRPASPTAEPSTLTPLVWPPTSTLIPTVESVAPTPTTATAKPQFFNAKFALDPNISLYQNIFPAKTKRIYAVWEYRNMREGMLVRRDWYHNDQLWLSREEPWDYSKYGASGTMRDISVYELDTGLLPGFYRFELYIDTQPQPIFGGVYWPTFTITENEFREQVISPAGSWIALIHDPALLSIVDPNGNVQEMYQGTEIINLAWFPDSQHILFLDRGLRDDLRILDVISGQTYLLYESETALGIVDGLMVSPDGRYVMSSEGSGGGDACFVDLQVIFFEIAGNFQSAGVIHQDQFEGLPNVPDSSVYPVEVGAWQNNNEYGVPLKLTCVTDESLAGQYVFDMASMTATKK